VFDGARINAVTTGFKERRLPGGEEPELRGADVLKGLGYRESRTTGFCVNCRGNGNGEEHRTSWDIIRGRGHTTSRDGDGIWRWC